MMKMTNVLVAALVVVIVAAGLSGCKKEGPAERAGKEIDRSVEKAGKEIEKAGGIMKDVIKEIKK